MRFSKAQSAAVSAFGHVQSFGRVLLGVCVLAFLATFLLSVHTRPASATAPGSSVTIANTPLPVTGNVNATVSGTVGISGTPSVNISNTPSVSISGTPTVSLASSTGSLPVTATGDPASSGFTQASGNSGASFAPSTNYCLVTFPNPASAGQILVIENVGAQITLPTGYKINNMYIATNVFNNVWMPTYQADNGTTAIFGTSQPMRMYVAANSPLIQVVAYASSDPGSNGFCSFSYSGYVVNVH